MKDNQSRPRTAIASFPEVTEAPVSWGRKDLKRADEFKAIVNPNTGKVFSIVLVVYLQYNNNQYTKQKKVFQPFFIHDTP